MKTCPCGSPVGDSPSQIREKRCGQCLGDRNKNWNKKNPWSVALTRARGRCTNPNIERFKDYGGRGIKCLLTLAEIKTLWDRDGASKMEVPSIDRIDIDGNYEFGNCRFIERRENSKRTRLTRFGCAVCGPEAKHYGLGFCEQCYSSKVTLPRRKWAKKPPARYAECEKCGVSQIRLQKNGRPINHTPGLRSVERAKPAWRCSGSRAPVESKPKEGA